MNYLPPKIEFYRKRDFSEKLNVTFQFIRENWKPLVKYAIYLLLPICLIQSFVMNASISSIFELSRTNNMGSFSVFFKNYGLAILCASAGSILLSSLIYTLMQTYEKREHRLLNVQWSDFTAQLMKNLKRSLKLLLVTTVVAILLMGFFVALFYFLYTIYPALIVIGVLIWLAVCICLIPLILLLPVYILEPEITISQAISKAWKFGISDFWSLLGFLIVVSIISSILQTITLMPWYIVTIVKFVFAFGSDPAITQSIFYKFAVYILGIIQSMGTYVSSIIMVTGIAFQYFHSREKHEGVTIESNIINFNELQ
ncbi:MAG: hypothetical protein LBT24_05595 [Tannerella sp.]|jgi:hypothetical protein|nr:hypothetical protein [Tannerella sp.]